MICTTCPIREACLAATLEHEAQDEDGFRWGVAGGLTATERAILVAEQADPLVTRPRVSADTMTTVRAARTPAGAKTHCPHGHAMTDDNVRTSNGRRFCIACSRRHGERRKRERAEARAAAAATPAPLPPPKSDSSKRRRARIEAQPDDETWTRDPVRHIQISNMGRVRKQRNSRPIIGDVP